MTTPTLHQFSLLDLVFWTFWIAVLSSVVRLKYDDSFGSDKWQLVTICLAASISLAAVWGHAAKSPKSIRYAARFGVIFAGGLIGLLLWDGMSTTGFTGLELAAMVMASFVIVVVGYKI
jgi:hypothetical protein